MKKNLALIRAVMSEDMNPFAFKTKAKSSRFSKILLPFFLTMVMMSSVAGYAYMFAEPLAKVGLTNVMLILFIFMITITSFMEGIYKSQGILFNAKDDDLLFSLPISKKSILFVRILKLLVFQYIFNILFLAPSIAVYAYFAHPRISFYIITIIYSILIPVIPTVLSSIIGYLIKMLTSKFKAKKIIQTILTLTFTLLIFILSFNFNSVVKKIIQNADSINLALNKIYYPIGAYSTLIEKFNILTFIKLLLFCLIPLILFVYLGSIYYFKVVSSSKEFGLIKRKSKKEIKRHSKVSALVKKELLRFINTPIYMFNTLFGVFMLFIVSIVLCIKVEGIYKLINIEGLDISNLITLYLPVILCGVIIFVSNMTLITSCSISIEGKSFNLLKSLPIKSDTIFIAKILTSDLIVIPFILIADILLIIKFKISVIYCVFVIILTFIVPTLSAMIGLIINLKYPKLEFNSETEVVKQSLSVLVSELIGIAVTAISILALIHFIKHVKLVLSLLVIVYIILIIILWILLKSYGFKKYRELNY